MAADRVATGSAFVGVREPRMWRSDNGGASWTALTTTVLRPTESSELQAVAIDPDSPDRAFVRGRLDRGAARPR